MMFRAIPLSNWVLIILLVIASVFATATMGPDRVEARVAAPQTGEQAPDAATCSPYSWRYRTVQAQKQIFSGWVTLTFEYRYNGCQVEGRWASWGGHTTLFSVKKDWHGFYQPADWYKSKLHAGINYTVCSTPVSGVGACWSEYFRVQVTRTGALSAWGSGIIYVWYL